MHGLLSRTLQFIRSSWTSHLACLLLQKPYLMLVIFTKVPKFPLIPSGLLCDVICKRNSSTNLRKTTFLSTSKIERAGFKACPWLGNLSTSFCYLATKVVLVTIAPQVFITRLLSQTRWRIVYNFAL